MLNLNYSTRVTSAQSLTAALMLLHPKRDTMEKVILKLAAHRHLWSTFVLAPAVPTADQEVYSGVSTSLRDLALGWVSDMLSVLSSDSNTAEVLRSITLRWEGGEISICPFKCTEYPVSEPDILVAIRWQVATQISRKNDYNKLHIDDSRAQLDLTRPLRKCNAKTIVSVLIQ